VEIIGFPDDSSALMEFVLAKSAASGVSPPLRVVSRSVSGGPAHPRITMVNMSDPHWCGSGGCTLFILVPGEDGLTEIGRITLVHAPVVALDTQTEGMPDILVRVRSDYYPGDGRKFVALPFGGQAYASNPTMPPARLLLEPADGEIAISEGDVEIAFGR